jgi:hypothetical protein
MQVAGRPNEAEDWYVKALRTQQTNDDRAGESSTRNNLAALLARLPGRLAAARSHAEQALAIKKTLDPAAAQIWTTYSILADIADQQGDADAARDWRREERASYAAAPVSRHLLKGQRPLIAAVVQAASNPSARRALDPVLATIVARGRTSQIGVLRRILDGSRNEDALCASLDREDSTIVAAVLRGIADPATLNEIAPADPDAAAPAPAPSSAPAPASAPTDLRARLEPHLPLVAAIIAATAQPQLRSELDPVLEQMRQHGWDNLTGAVRRILDGERDANALAASLDDEDSLIIHAILTGLDNPDASL